VERGKDLLRRLYSVDDSCINFSILSSPFPVRFTGREWAIVTALGNLPYWLEAPVTERKLQGESYLRSTLDRAKRAAFGVFLGVFTFIVAERERKRGASRWSWMMLGAFGIVLLSFGIMWFIVMVSS
jgi:hypothetical protein